MSPATRRRYPKKAVLFVVLASFLALVDVILMALFLMPLIPLIPVFVMMVIGQATLIAAAVDYARSLAREEPTKRAEAKTEASRSQASESVGVSEARAT